MGVELGCPLFVFDRGVDFLGFESFCFYKKGMIVVQDNEMVVYA